MFMIIFLILISSLANELVINEVLYDPVGKDMGCFIELKGIPGMKLDGYFLVGIDGDTGKEYCVIDLTGHKVPQSGFFVIAQDDSVWGANMIDPKADLQNGPDNIELWYINKKIDALGYGDFSKAKFTGEGQPTLDVPGYSIGRRPDGFDTNNNSVDLVGLAFSSPGKPNLPKVCVIPISKTLYKWGAIKGYN
ncbi:MAG: hypothetical protein ACUVWN_10455 [bacterium]